MLDCVFERSNQALVFGKIVGLMAKILAEGSNVLSALILDDDAVTGGAGIAACAAVGVGNEIVVGLRVGVCHGSFVAAKFWPKFHVSSVTVPSVPFLNLTTPP